MHNIDRTNDRDNVAYLGSRNNVWHKLGQEMEEGEALETWAVQAGLDWNAVKVPAYADLTSLNMHNKVMPDREFIVRNDTGDILGLVSDQYKIVQPLEVLNWFEQYISVDERFKLDVAGSLDGGRKIWATAKFDHDLLVASEKIDSRLLLTTSLDGTMSTTAQMTSTRVVCQNTLNMSLTDRRAKVTVTHRSKFDANTVAKELSDLGQSVDAFKAMGDAMAQHHMASQEIEKFFKKLLDIPEQATLDNISTRKINQFNSLLISHKKSIDEGAERDTQWSVLQAVTRFVDHNRSVKRGDFASTDVARFASAQFGTGANLKDRAVKLLVAA